MADSNAIQILIEAQSRAQAGFDKAKAETVAFKSAIASLGPNAGASGAALEKMLQGSQQRMAAAGTSVKGLDAALLAMGVTGRRSALTVATALDVLRNSTRQAHDPVSALTTAFTSFGKAGLAIAGVGLALAAVGVAAKAAFGAAGRVEELERLAAQMGASAADVQVLQRSLQNLGLGAGDANVAMTTLARQISEGNPLLAQLGITSRNAYQAMLQLGDALQRVRDPADRVRVVFELTGRGGAAMTGVLGKLGDETKRVGGIFTEFGGSITKLDQARFGNLDRSMDDLATRVEALRFSFARLGIPAAEFIVGQLGALARAANDVREAFKAPLGESFLGDALKGVWALTTAYRDLLAMMANAGHSIVKPIGDMLMSMPAGRPTAQGEAFERSEGGAKLDFLAKAVASIRSRAASGAEGGDIDVDFDSRRSSARAERLKEIQRLLHLNEEAAKDVLKALESWEDATAVVKLKEQLEQARSAAVGLKDELTAAAGDTGAIPSARELRKVFVDRSLPEIGEEQPEVQALFDPMRQGIENFRRDAASILDTANAVREGLHGLAETFAGSISNVFQTMLFSAKDTGKAIIALVQNMVSEMIVQLIRLAVFKLFFNLFTGGAGSLGTTMGSTGFSYPVAATVGGAGAASASAVQSGPERVTNVTVYAQALDMQSLASSFQDPYGPVRRHLERAFEVAAA